MSTDQFAEQKGVLLQKSEISTTSCGRERYSSIHSTSPCQEYFEGVWFEGQTNGYFTINHTHSPASAKSPPPLN